MDDEPLTMERVDESPLVLVLDRAIDDRRQTIFSYQWSMANRQSSALVYNVIMRILLRLWRLLPLWVHLLASRIVRPKFQAAVAALVFDEQGRVLLFKHTYRKWEWGIPAGSLEHREQPAEAVLREFYEETQMQIQVEKLLTVVSAREDHHLTIVYLCKIISGEFKASNEVSEMKYFDVNALPQMLFAEKDLIRQVASGAIS
jgi:8-oxo-dGTP diphosphatase